MKEAYIIATIKSWNIRNAREFIKRHKEASFYLITDKDELNFNVLRDKKPKYIFFPHWSWIIPSEIYNNFNCVVFHMTDLPFGRGGSPLQNLILRNIASAKISAIKVIKELDAGPVYLKRSLSLFGTAQEIYERASKKVFKEMIPYIIKNEPIPKPQSGRKVIFKRRKPQESLIPGKIDLKRVYDYIRMLDAEGYPRAFIETPRLKIEFSGAKLKKDVIVAEAYIKEKRDEE